MSLNQDSYESNNDRLNATVLEKAASTIKGLTIHDDSDVDCYKLTLTNTGAAKNLVKAIFSKAAGAMEMKLYDASGAEVPGFTVAAPNATTRQISLAGLAEGEYYIKISGIDGAQNSYNLTWDQTNYGPKIDTYEGTTGNDTLATATVLSAKGSVGNRSIHSVRDVDYYKLNLTNTGMAKNLIKAVFSKPTGEMEMKLYDASGQEVPDFSAAAPNATTRQISLEGLAEGAYYVTISGVDGAQSAYSLAWDQTNYGPKIDAWEGETGNETLAAATVLSAKGSVGNRSIHSVRDVDNYKLNLTNTGTAKNLVKAVFSKPTGEMEMKLYDASGQEVSGFSAVAVNATTRQISLEGLAEGVYYVTISGVDGAQSTYSLTWDQTNYGPKIDAWEGETGNDTRTTATVLSAKGSAGNRSIHSVRDVDNYKLNLTNTGTAKNLIKAVFSKPTGDMEMKLYDASGQEVSGFSAVAVNATTRQISLEGLAEGAYYVTISGVDGAQSAYSLAWDQTNYGPKIDAWEGETGNDTLAAATVLTTKGSVGSRSIHSVRDVDYYKLNLTNIGTAKNLVKAVFSKPTGEMAMKLYDAAGQEVSGFSAVAVNATTRQISLEGLAEGAYYARISGVDGAQSAYSLAWDQTNYGPKIDAWEGETGNETLAAATVLSAKGSAGSRSIHSVRDVDNYKLNLTNIGMAKNLVKAVFSKPTGEMAMKLYDASGQEVSGFSAAAPNATTRQISLEGLAEGEYYVRISGVDGAQSTYSLTWDQTNYGPKIDTYEGETGNDTLAAATVLTTKGSAGSRSIHSVRDVDYYKLNLANTGMAKNLVKAVFSKPTGEMAMKLYDASGQEVSGFSAASPNATTRQIGLEGLAEGVYYVRISGVDGAQSTYSLTWDQTNYGPKIDAWEGETGNDTLAAATVLTTKGSAGSRSIHSVRDVDYYKLNLTNTGMAKNLVKAVFSKPTGDMEMKLYDASGVEVSGFSAIAVNATTLQISLEGLAEGEYYVKVNGVDGAQSAYSLTWDCTNYGPKADSYETGVGNNTRETATALAAFKSSAKSRTIHSVSDVDYYKITLLNAGTAKNMVKAAFTNTKGNLDMKLYNAQGEEISSSTSLTADFEEISLQGLAEGDYYLAVYGVNGAQNTYTLTWDRTNYGPKVDKFEGAYGNNSIERAASLPYRGGWYNGSTSIHSETDVDYYKFRLDGIGTAKNFFEINGINATGELALIICDSVGEEVRTATYTSSTSMQVSFQGLNPGSYYVKVAGVDGAIGSHNIKWDSWYYEQSFADKAGKDMWTADDFESNESIASAATLLTRAGNTGNLTIHNSTDVDYYKLTLSATGTSANYVQALFTQASGNLALTLYNASGTPVLWSSTGKNSETISLAGLGAGSYYLEVRGVDGAQNTYSLAWDRTNNSVAAPDISTATVLGSGSLSNIILSESEDVRYYTFNLASLGTAANHITVTSGDDLQIALLDAQGRKLYGTDSRERINLSGLDSGTYYLEIKGAGIHSGTASRFNIDYDLNSPSSEVVMGTDYYSLFTLNGAQTEYAYLMGYGNIDVSDFSVSSAAKTRMTYVNDIIIDADKNARNNNNYQCWAATASNMLTWTGWAEAGISSATGGKAEDVLFADYGKYFPNRANSVEDGIRWFLSAPYKYYSNSLTAKSGGGNYVGLSYTLDKITRSAITGVSSMHSLVEALDNNMGVGLCLGGLSSSGHAVSVWGYTYDITKSSDDGGYYTGLLITDSNDGYNAASAIEAPDTLRMITLNWNKKTGKYSTPYYGAVTHFWTLDHIGDWPDTSTTALADLSLPSGQDGLLTGSANLDSLLACATQPTVESLQAASELTYSDDRYKQNGMLSA